MFCVIALPSFRRSVDRSRFASGAGVAKRAAAGRHGACGTSANPVLSAAGAAEAPAKSRSGALDIRIESLREGACRAVGAVAIIDVFRAFTTAA